MKIQTICEMNDFYKTVYYRNINDSTIYNNTLNNSAHDLIFTYEGKRLNISNNTLYNNQRGEIAFFGSNLVNFANITTYNSTKESISINNTETRISGTNSICGDGGMIIRNAGVISTGDTRVSG